MSAPFNCAELPRLGVGISAEFGVRPSIDPSSFAAAHPGLIHFVEFGSDVERGLDPTILHWVEAGGGATYHFLDVNFEDPQDLDAAWMEATRGFAQRLRSPWLCGDAGLWHFGPRDRGHGLLLPPILSADSARRAGEQIGLLQERCGLPVLPENPPGLYFLGELHLLDYFARACEEAGSGMLLDAAHLAIYQQVAGCDPLDGLDDFPLERIVEVHVAGGGERVTADGFRYLDDDHRAQVLDSTWQIVEKIVSEAPNLKAVVYECEHNAEDHVVPCFERLNALFPRSPEPHDAADAS